jgi:hypothetical protein
MRAWASVRTRADGTGRRQIHIKPVGAVQFR